MPLASPTKLATVLGAWSSKRLRVMSPWLVCRVAVEATVLPFVEDESFLFTLPIDVGSREFSAKRYRWLERGIPWIVLDHELDPY